MKNLNSSLVLILTLLSISIFAQEAKLKGNRNVVSEKRAISEFNSIEVIDNINVLLVYNEQQSVNVKTDSNLQEAVLTEVNNGTLTIKTALKIVRKKELTVLVKVNKNLKEIYAYNNASVSSNNLLIIDSLKLNAYDNSNFNLKLNSKNFHLSGKKLSKFKLEILADDITINTEENCGIDAVIDAKNITVNLLDRSNFTLDGTTTNLNVSLYGSSVFKGKNCFSETAVINVSNNSNASINASKTLEILAKNSAKVFVYSNPKITLAEFFDKASIHKRELDKKLF